MAEMKLTYITEHEEELLEKITEREEELLAKIREHTEQGRPVMVVVRSAHGRRSYGFEPVV